MSNEDEAQGSQAWLEARAGCATASCFADIIAVSKKDGKPLKARDDYLWKCATERFYGTPTEAFTSRPTDWGKDLEPFAKQAYEMETGFVLEESGFLLHPDIPYCGCSPDGLIGDKGGAEFKAPKDRRIHMQTWLTGMPEGHLPQVQGCMWITGREWWDFNSFDPRAPEGFRLYVQRIYRDEKYILALASHVTDFLAEVDQLIKEFHGKVRRI